MYEWQEVHGSNFFQISDFNYKIGQIDPCLSKSSHKEGPLKAPLEAVSKFPKIPKILSGRFWQISIWKSDLPFDLGNFYLERGYGV